MLSLCGNLVARDTFVYTYQNELVRVHLGICSVRLNLQSVKLQPQSLKGEGANRQKTAGPRH